MSLITDFPFHAFMADIKTRHDIPRKSGVSLSLLSSEEIQDMSAVEVRAAAGDESRTEPWLPVLRMHEALPTFYDTRMGNFIVKGFPTQACSTCAQSRSATSAKLGNERCSGHFGYISMPRKYPDDPQRSSECMHVINPHLSEETENLLQAKCFFCHKFRASVYDVDRFRLTLWLLDAGLVGDALDFLDMVASLKDQLARQRRTTRCNERVISTEGMMRELAYRVLIRHNVIPAASVVVSEERSEEDVAVEVQELVAKYAKEHSEVPALDVRQGICKTAIRELRDHSHTCSHCQCVSPNISSHNGHLFFHFPRQSADENVSRGALTLEMLEAWKAANARHGRHFSYLHTGDARDHLKQLCQRESGILGMLFPRMGEATVDVPFEAPVPPNMLYKLFFLDKLLVPPLPVRLSSGLRVSDSGAIMADDCTRGLSTVLKYVQQVEVYNRMVQHKGKGGGGPTEEQERSHEQNLRNLQAKVAELYSTVLESFAKKEGLFRMHMMGKRVNQACRSVISPDYMVESNEVLLPRPFARNLTYPEQVSSHSSARMSLLKRCVVNGPSVYPGATHLEWRMSTGEIRFVDLNVSEPQRRQHANRYFSMASTGTLIVHRHILSGDRLIFNRQPTLHKVSMLGYRAKVLSGLKTLRFHYVNGKSYNADFDGDEMNIHVPQSLEAKAELECLMDADMNYLVPTSGKPIRGLIQDHLVAAVLLTTRDKFFDRGTFTQLVFTGLAPYLLRQTLSLGITLSGLIPVPAVLLPVPQWTGKQLVSVLLKFLTGVSESQLCSGAPARAGVSLRGISLIQPNVYTRTELHQPGTPLVAPTRLSMDDDRVIIQNSELLVGVLDKNQLGPSNLSVPHVIHEVYGPHVVGALLGAIGRVLTVGLQREGFSMGMDDMMLVLEPRRSELMEALDLAPLKMSDADGADEAKVMPVIMKMTTEIQKEFVPGRLLRPFPVNQLLMMTVSGAKGSNTNAIQMALSLGQQLFDGRRVAAMNSGKTLPPFFVGDRRARSFGYAMGRFASGIRPAEYTIHAMAGRDGLIDTAVKTSRSGHLQRCLIKGLESLVVQWDHSVRDANGAVIQFLYGGDGLDPVKASTLTTWDVVKENQEDIARRFGIDSVIQAEDGDESREPGEKRHRMDEEMAALQEKKKAALMQHAHRHPLPPHVKDSLHQYLEKDTTAFTLFKKVSQVERWEKKGALKERMAERRRDCAAYYEDVMQDITTFKRAGAFCDAGEPVGLLAAQAAGEPSTQMTLNTFHSAGSTVTHVTEGIPRLRELLIYASVKNAAVIVPVKGAKEADEEAIRRILRAGPSIRLASCLAVAGSSSKSSGEAAQGYRYHIQRHSNGIVYHISMLFSTSLLEHAGDSMCMIPSEHSQHYLAALKEFAKKVVVELSGTTRSGGAKEEEEDAAAGASGPGLIRQPVSNPAAMATRKRGVVKSEDDMGEGNGSSDEEEGRDDDRRRKRKAGTQKEKKRAAKKLKVEHDSDDSSDDDEDDSNAEDGTEDEDEGSASEGNPSEDDDDEEEVPQAAVKKEGGKKKKAGRQHEDEEEDSEDELLTSLADSIPQTTSEGKAATYSSFKPIHFALRGGKYRVAMEPRRLPSSSSDDDLFLVDIRIASLENTVVTVLPDVIDGILMHQAIPSFLPQFESVRFTRSTGDESSGELVFQGPTANLDNVFTLLSLLTVGTTGAIQMHKAHSTNIHHMVHSLGVESGYGSLLAELTQLFKRYAVDYHHLSLIADAATNRGRWENFNFTGVISRSSSPLFQMTFASSKKFLHTTVTRGIRDDLQSFSASIMVGERPRVGTACVRLVQDYSMLQDIVEHTIPSAA